MASVLKKTKNQKLSHTKEIDITRLMFQICYTFKDSNILKIALTHPSKTNENQLFEHHERLEFLGDAVLSLIVSNILMNKFQKAQEGVLSRTRAQLVSEEALSQYAQVLNLGDFLFLGQGEDKSGGRYKNSILANTYEALVAAIYLDGGYEQAYQFVFTPIMHALKDVQTRVIDHKTELQEYCQAKKQGLPVYKMTHQSGPDHQRIYHVEVCLKDQVIGRGFGSSKKIAEQAAACQALSLLCNKD